MAGYTTIVVAAGLLVWAVASRGVAGAARADIERSLAAQARLLGLLAAPDLGTPRAATLQARLAGIASATDTRCTICDAEGRVVADTREAPARMGSHANRPEILAARASGSGTAERFSATTGVATLYVAQAVRRDGVCVGVVRAALPVAAVDARLARLRSQVALGTAIALGAALLLGIWGARRVARPIEAMTAAATALAADETQTPVPVDQRGELGLLADALQRLGASARERLAAATVERQTVLAILDAMDEGVLAVDPAERVVHLNAAAARLLDADPAAAVGRPLWEVTRARPIARIVAEVRTRAAPAESQWERPADAAARVVRLRASPLAARGGAAAGVVLVLHDVSETTRLEHLRRDFVANASHELKTPITAIRGLIETILDDATMPAATQSRFLQRGREQAVRLSALVTDLLTLSRLEATGAGVEFAACDLGAIARAAQAAIQPMADARRHTLVVDLPAEPVRVRADADAVRQACINLLDNACKYTPDGGRITLRVAAGDHQATIEVADTGPGIAPEHLPRLFERFYRVDKARSRELGGTGLGLAIVKHVALNHGGDVACESTPGQGAVFRVVLPRRAGDLPVL